MIRNKTKQKPRVVVGMSGGVDSSTTAALLQRDGFDVVGVFMKCWNVDDFKQGEPARHRHAQVLAGGCTAEEDEFWARRAAAHLGIPFYSVDLVAEYKKRVVDYFVREYAAGRTPNPDVMCNNEIKFGVFFDTVINNFDADYIATGHYARRGREVSISNDQLSNKNVTLLKAVDPNKDQTYFLHRVAAEKIAKTLFPLGDYTKPQVRALARKFGLPNAEKKDSQGLCFIGKVDVREFLAEYIPPKEGVIVTTNGEEVGTHNGAAFYTIGQRHGLGVGGGVPYYVVDKDVEKNTVTVATRYDEKLFAKRITLEDAHWINEPPREGEKITANIRYRQKPQRASICKEKENWVLEFDEEQRAATPGQSAVVYRGEEVLGGGIIR